MKTTIPASREEWLSLRLNYINSTEVSILFGLNPYQTLFELWHTKKSKILTDFVINDRMKWGTRLQDSIAKGIAEDNNFIIVPMPEYKYDEHHKTGSSFDYCIMNEEKQIAILEIKNVDSLVFNKSWIKEDENIEAPMHIELQVQHQLYHSELDKCYIGALVGGNNIVLIERTRDEDIIKSILNKSDEFWESIESNKEPRPDFIKDAEFIIGLNNKSSEGKIVSIKDDMDLAQLALHYKQLSDKIKELEETKSSIKAQMLMHIGDAEKALGELFTISAKNIVGKKIEYLRKDYRDFRINWKNQDEIR